MPIYTPGGSSGGGGTDHTLATKNAANDTYAAGEVVMCKINTGQLADLDDLAYGVPIGRANAETTTASATDELVLTGEPNDLAVTSVTGLDNNNDVGKLVYQTAATTRTLTAPTDDRKVTGFITRYDSAGAGQMNEFGADAMYLMNMAGLHTETIVLPCRVGWAGYIFGNATIGYRLNGHGKVTSIAVVSVNPAASAEGGTDPVVTPRINGTACNAGVTVAGINLDVYDQSTGPSAITATNTFADGDILSLHSSAAFSGNCMHAFIITLERTL